MEVVVTLFIVNVRLPLSTGLHSVCIDALQLHALEEGAQLRSHGDESRQRLGKAEVEEATSINFPNCAAWEFLRYFVMKKSPLMSTYSAKSCS